MTADRGWKREFDEPIPLPSGRSLVTLKDAGTYITKLPKSDHATPEWQAATMFARIGIMRAMNRHVERVFNPSRKDTHWGRRKLTRDR